MEVPHLIGGFKQRFDQFVKVYKDLKQENKHLKLKLQEIEVKLEQSEKENQELNKKLQTSDLANTFLASEKGNKDAKNKINQIVREIDNCIALLNR